MSRRMLRAGMLSAALFGLAPLAVAKPPDLPADVKNVVTPQVAPTGAELSLFEPWLQLCEPETAEREPAFYRLHLAERKLMTSCLLFGVHPLLALAPTDDVMYWPMEIREALEDAAEDQATARSAPQPGLRAALAAAQIAGPTGALIGSAAGGKSDAELPGTTGPAPEAPTGVLKIGLGVSTTGGVTGSVDVREGIATRAVTFGLGMNSDGGLTGSLDLNVSVDEVKSGFMNLLRTNKGAALNSDAGLSGSIVLNERNFDVFPAPAVPADSICPHLRQAQPAPAVVVPERTALENLKALEEVEQRRKPTDVDSWLDGWQRCLEMVFPFMHLHSNDESMRINEMLNTSEDLRQIRAEWERIWNIDPVGPPAYDRIHGGLQAFEEDDEDDAPGEFELFGTPLWRILSDIVCGQGFNLYPEKPPVPVGQGEEQEIRLRETTEPRPARDLEHSRRAEKEIARHLNMPVTLHYRDVPLTQVIEDLRNAYGLNFVVDERALADKGISAARAVSFKVDQVYLKNALKTMLRNLDLAYVIEDGAIHITTPERAGGKLGLATYQVADLVVCEKGGEMPLIRMITNNVSPADWTDLGGAGTIDYHPQTQSLVVNQTADVHEQIADLLAALRRLNEAQQETVAGCVPAGAVCVEAGARLMADGLLKAARLALENGDHTRAADLARQAYALDPARMSQDASAYSLYLLVRQGTAMGGRRVNNCGPDCPCPAGCECKSPCVCLTKALTLRQPSMRPNLPGVDPRVVAAMEKVLAEADAKRPRLVLVIEEEQEPRVQERSVELTKPFILGGPAAPNRCGDWMKTVAHFRLFGLEVKDPETKAPKRLTYSLLGWFLEEVAPAENDD